MISLYENGVHSGPCKGIKKLPVLPYSPSCRQWGHSYCHYGHSSCDAITVYEDNTQSSKASPKVPGSLQRCVSVCMPIEMEMAKIIYMCQFAFLMKGENDDYLPWPFTGIITLSFLTNWRTRTITPCLRNSLLMTILAE